jgi:hypothetical protein
VPDNQIGEFFYQSGMIIGDNGQHQVDGIRHFVLTHYG